jgi:mono/diheme cytochrome c family protein
VQAETDGELFYKISEGREDMPAFKKKIPDEEDRWSVVNFTRTFKK